MSARGGKEARLVFGASPRVDLLPPEVADRKRGAAVKRSVVFVVVGALVLCAGAYGFASWQAIDAGLKLSDAQGETARLLTEQNEYAAVRTLTGQLVAVNDARQVGALTEVDWNALYSRILPTLPADMTIDSFSIESSSPVVAISPSTVPGQVPQVANTTFTALTTNLASAQTWIVNLKSLPEYGGAVATSITREEGIYTVTVRLFLTDAAYTLRFAPEPVENTLTEEGETK